MDKRKANQNEDIDDLIFEDCDQSVFKNQVINVLILVWVLFLYAKKRSD